MNHIKNLHFLLCVLALWGFLFYIYLKEKNPVFKRRKRYVLLIYSLIMLSLFLPIIAYWLSQMM